MTSKLLIFLTTCVLLHVHAVDSEGRENAESYITKEAAKELRNKLSHIKNDGNVEEQQDDYDEILKEIIHTMEKSQGPKEHQHHHHHHQQQPQQQQTTYHEKKYFDYLPNEISDSDDVTSENLSHELVKKESDYNSLKDEQQHMVNNDAINADDEEKEKRGGRRIVKRDVMQQDDVKKGRAKRQNLYYVPLTHFTPFQNVHFYYPSYDPLFSEIFNPPASESRFQAIDTVPMQQYDRGINPFSAQYNPNIRLHSPHNFYLPPSPTYLPVPPTNRPPNNIPNPPDNQGGDEIGERVSGFEDNERPVWESSFIPNRDANRGTGGTKRPTQPPVIRPINHQQNQQGRPPRPNTIEDEKVYTPNEKPEFDIEYAPELEEDVTSTTRASIVLPNRKKNQQNKNRQKKEDIETTVKPPSANFQSAVNVQPLYSQQVDSSRPKKPLSRCVEAIVNCCSKYDEIVKVSCFESYSCKGTFFDQNPCGRAIKEAAYREYEKYRN